MHEQPAPDAELEWQHHKAEFLRRRRHHPLHAVFTEDWPCDDCRGWIVAGDTAVMTGWGVFHDCCPSRPALRLIRGDGEGNQLQLALLAVVPEVEA